MILFFIFVVIIYLVDIFLVGASFAAIKRVFNLNISVIKSILILIVAFALLDNLVTPLVDYLDLTFTIRNQEIANFFELKENTPASMFFSIGYFDFIIWLVESLIAVFVVDKRITKKINSR